MRLIVGHLWPAFISYHLGKYPFGPWKGFSAVSSVKGSIPCENVSKAISLSFQRVKFRMTQHIDNRELRWQWASLVAQTIKSLPAMQETWVRSLGQEDPLEKGMATHSSILDWRMPWTEESGRLQSMGSQRVGHD